jgi:hypothetical protein
MNTGGSVAYIVWKQLWRVVRFVFSLICKLLPAGAAPAPRSSFKAASSHPQHQQQPQHQSAKQGKSLKQLLKESKMAAAAAHAHEKIPESDFYLNSLKGHGDCVVSVAISEDNSHIITSCEDQVRPRSAACPCSCMVGSVRSPTWSVTLKQVQVVRMYNMRGDFSNPNPGLVRLPMPGNPLGAAFWGSNSTAAACVEGLGQVANFVVSSASSGRKGAQYTVALERIHGDSVAKAMHSAPTSGGGVPVMATMTRTKSVAVILGSNKVAEVEPNGIENYQVPSTISCVSLISVQTLAQQDFQLPLVWIVKGLAQAYWMPVQTCIVCAPAPAARELSRQGTPSWPGMGSWASLGSQHAIARSNETCRSCCPPMAAF